MPVRRICDNPLCGRTLDNKEVVIGIHRKGKLQVKRKSGPSGQSRARVKHTCDRCADLAFIQFLRLANPVKQPADPEKKERGCDNCGTLITDDTEVILHLDRRGDFIKRRKPGRKSDTSARHVCARCAQLGYVDFLPISQESIGEPNELVIQNPNPESKPREETPAVVSVGPVPAPIRERLALDADSV